MAGHKKILNFSSTPSAKENLEEAARRIATEQQRAREAQDNAAHARQLELACIGAGRTLQQCFPERFR